MHAPDGLISAADVTKARSGTLPRGFTFTKYDWRALSPILASRCILARDAVFNDVPDR